MERSSYLAEVTAKPVTNSMLPLETNVLATSELTHVDDSCLSTSSLSSLLRVYPICCLSLYYILLLCSGLYPGSLWQISAKRNSESQTVFPPSIQVLL